MKSTRQLDLISAITSELTSCMAANTRGESGEWIVLVATKAVDNVTAKAMEYTEKLAEDVNGSSLDPEPDRWCHVGNMPWSFFEVLWQLTSGEAKAVIKDVEEGEGYIAWQALLRRSHNRRSPEASVPKRMRSPSGKCRS